MKDEFPRVPYGCTVHGDEEIEAVVEVLKSSTQMGPKVSLFEERISSLFEKDHGLMVNSGSSALYLAIEALGLEAGSEVITPSLTFATTVACLVKNNLKPSFVDVTENTYCINEDAIEAAITKRTKAILAPDLLGNLCNWKNIREIADKYGLLVLHDSADTLGATLNDEYPGKYTDLSITSFYGSHIINGAGNGGMLCTSDDEILRKTKLLRSWGRASSIFQDSESIENRFKVQLEGIQYDAKFVFEELGYQLEPSEISAAFGLIQLNKLSKNLELRRKYFSLHNEFFKNHEDLFILPRETPGAFTGWLAYPLIVKENAHFSRTDLQIFLEERNIQTRVIFTGNILRQPGFKDLDCIGKADDFVNSDVVMRGGILLACHHGLDDDLLGHVHDSIKIFLDKN
ncbi:MAG: DegT/DnrJ/EryC1/StrS family aminotransferase [SAR86 cluster bacterium]|jgi:CDP-4-dehydro-6-deoxyglucose reductase, E1|nr:DegT/DnrJ/EryC1/StrS family aminotransferase [SAR86 cluster bacterium]|tara:strand:+ start:6386 stop:7588 length:1203 start_codon:yes stop_codon:yes gene_type:complete